MKTRLLHGIDLARNALLPADLKRRGLQQIRDYYPPHTYLPFRATKPDILNLQSELFAPAPPTEWSKIRKRIADLSRSPEEQKSNLRVAAGLHQEALKKSIQARHEHFEPIMLTSINAKLAFWDSALLLVDDEPILPFFDPRLGYRLTELGRRFAFSLMFHHIVFADTDFAKVKPVIIQFGPTEGALRKPIFTYGKKEDILDFEFVDDKIRETYAMWFEIQNEREEERKRASGGKRGSLL